ncbi:hypothetical protein KO481_12415 [Nocardia sp. NEAU-G5]|uniref:Uncharacterized protein n=1 Tax=Nocardia albiluteola TaxID=2842303 RepID=A0ABS6AXU0_9NOCA|nr:hypothetical protein [Nocardia albiluteola]MBU3062326.1 hypothetical protein [Nocardia albiluteola]
MLLTWIREVADEPLLIDPTAGDAEVRENTWSLSTSVDERGSLSVHDVVAAFEECASVLRERIRSLGYEGPATFYVWHDAQAGQLRCSTTSLPPDQLPFRAPVEAAVSLAVIVEEFLKDVSPGLVLWEDLEPVEQSADVTQPEHVVVRVWTVGVGARS